MISHKQAKQLKDAGFPQGGNETGKGYIVVYKKELVYVPFLSEIIEACGDGLFTLDRSMNGTWRAIKDDIRSIGSTPEEAVSNLWLALNPKK